MLTRRPLLTVCIIIILSLLSSCGTDQFLADDWHEPEGTDLPEAYIDPRLEPYLEDFADDMELELIDVQDAVDRFVYEELDGNTAGRCTTWSSGYSMIQIESGYSGWATKGLIYHELGHCVLFLTHEKDFDKLSIMQPVIYSGYVYENNWNTLIKELRRRVVRL